MGAVHHRFWGRGQCDPEEVNETMLSEMWGQVTQRMNFILVLRFWVIFPHHSRGECYDYLVTVYRFRFSGGKMGTFKTAVHLKQYITVNKVIDFISTCCLHIVVDYNIVE